MTSREETAQFPPRPSRQRTRKRSTIHLSLAQRWMFVLALVTFGLASAYTSIAVVSRVTPALFPGKSLGSLIPHLSDLSAIGINPSDSQSVFNRRINLLVMGIDQRPDGVALEPANTDTIMVASIDPASRQMSLLSVPRDLWVDITYPDGSKGQNRINASWAMGVLKGKTADAGAQQLERDLKNNFGIDIDYWLLLDFRSAEKLFDAVGGVDVTVPPELAVPQWYYSDDDIHAQWLSFSSGTQHMDGYHAVAFGRYRETDSDLYRVKRQQLVLTAALAKVLSLGLLNNPFELWDAYSALIKTNIPRGKMPGYALLIKDAQQQVRTYSLGDPVNGVATVQGWMTPGGADVLLWDGNNVQYWLNQAFRPSIYIGSRVEVRAAEGSVDDSREVALGHYLEFKGLTSVEIGPDDPPRPDTHVQVVGNSDDRQGLAQDVAKWLQLPASAIEVVPRADASEPDLVISVGASFKLPS